MIIYLDENLPKQLAEGLDIIQKPFSDNLNLQIETIALVNRFGRGIADEEWIPIAGTQKACFVTSDLNIRYKPHQHRLCKEYDLGMFFIPQSKKGLPYWEIVKILVKHWPHIIEYAHRTKRPFAYSCTSRKDKPESIPI